MYKPNTEGSGWVTPTRLRVLPLDPPGRHPRGSAAGGEGGPEEGRGGPHLPKRGRPFCPVTVCPATKTKDEGEREPRDRGRQDKARAVPRGARAAIPRLDGRSSHPGGDGERTSEPRTGVRYAKNVAGRRGQGEEPLSRSAADPPIADPAAATRSAPSSFSTETYPAIPRTPTRPGWLVM